MSEQSKPEQDLSELLRHRREKLSALREKKINPYPYVFKRTHTSKEVCDNFEKLESEAAQVSVCGRIISLRSHGKSIFFHILDGEGKIQVYIKSDEVGEEKYKLFELFDIGDFIGVCGKVFKTRTGEKTVRAEDFQLLSKSLHPLPEKWHGLQDKELRYRQRYLDLISNPDIKDTFVLRTKILSAMRRFLDNQGFLEVETPVLQPVYGGAFARPFITHHNALDIDLYLRIADELYLKRLIIGGLEKVYEVCKDFRNEGMDKNHNPEFSMLEAYQAYADYNDIMELGEKLFNFISFELYQTNKIKYQDEEIDFSPPWRRISFWESIEKYTGVDLSSAEEKKVREFAHESGIKSDTSIRIGKVIESIFDEKVQPNLIQPTLILDYPIEISPLAKKHRQKEGLTERFEGFIAGAELMNAFSELNDPLDQRERFEQQA
ncbi:MAG TPA: lysine--tRNA ligase, partial [Terriglobales bacterium]|nr:lysine--tRNA ligase [Terriglobales bacterium]